MNSINIQSRNYYLYFNLPLQILGIVSLFFFSNLSIAIFLPTLLISYVLIYWIGIQAGAHKLFAHRLWTPKNEFIKYSLAVLSCFGLMGGPVIWAQVHRHHHANSDNENDMHSPRHGLLHAYILWLFNLKTMNLSSIKDLLRDKTLCRINQYCRHIVLVVLAILFFVNFSIFAGVLWAAILTFHSEMLVNTFLHFFDKTSNTYATRNNKFLSWISGGSTLHMNHHDNPRLSNLRLSKWEFDGSYLFIRLLKK